MQLLRFGDGHRPVASPVCVTVGRLLTLEAGRAKVTLRLGRSGAAPEVTGAALVEGVLRGVLARLVG